MFFDDDDGDFTPKSAAGGSKLASLFGMGSGTGDNESLTYTAPKQPKSKDESNGKADQKGSSASVLNATAVHTFRYVNGQYVKQGKLGIAVLGDHKNADYKILLYVSQKQPVAAAKIHPNFTYTVQKNNYASFYDDQSQMWSICFESTSAAIEFGKMVALSKFNCSPVGLVTQDLVIGEGQDAQKGDNVELQYTGHLFTNQSFGKMFETNCDTGKLFKMKVGKGKVIRGWEEGVPGMRKGGKRLLIIPPGLAYGAKAVGDRIPASSTLIFEVDVTRAKFANPDPKYANLETTPNGNPGTAMSEQPKSANSGADKKPELPVISEPKSIDQPDAASTKLDAEVKDKEVQEKDHMLKASLEKDLRKGRTHSLSEQLSRSLEKSSGKADLLARMSKMGQAMIVTPQTSLEDHETKETADDENNQQHDQVQDSSARKEEYPVESPSKPAVKPRPEAAAPHPRHAHDNIDNPRTRPSHMHADYHNQSAMNQQQQQQQPMIQPPAIYQPTQPMYGMQLPGSMPFIQTVPTVQTIPPASASQSSGEMSLLMSESKIHHGEMKSAVNRVTERIDDLMLKIDRLEKSGFRQEVTKPISGNEIEASVLAANINRIMKENDRLKSDCAEKTTKIESLNEKISEMLLKNHSFLEKSNQLMEERADSIKSNATQAMVKINTLEQDNASLTTQLSTLSSQLSGFEAKLEEAKAREIELKSKIKKLKDERESLTEKFESANSNASDHKEELTKVQDKYKEEKQERKKLKAKLDHMEEEIQEAKQENESIAKALNDRKKKQQSDRKKFDEDIEELKNSHEEEINSLKQRYKKSSLENEKIAALEKELEAKHQEHLKKSLENTEKRWQEKYQELSVDNDKLKSEVSLLNEKLKKMRTLEDKNAELETQLEDLETAKNQVSKEANDQIENFKRKVQTLCEKNENIESEAFERGLAKGKAESHDNPEEMNSKSNAAEEVKKVMNGVFFKLKAEFEPDESYSGKDIMTEILQTIREVTLKLTEGQTKAEDSEEDEEEEEEEDEDEEEEEDEEGEEEEESEEEQEEVESDEEEDDDDDDDEEKGEEEDEVKDEEDKDEEEVEVEMEGEDEEVIEDEKEEVEERKGEEDVKVTQADSEIGMKRSEDYREVGGPQEEHLEDAQNDDTKENYNESEDEGGANEERSNIEPNEVMAEKNSEMQTGANDSYRAEDVTDVQNASTEEHVPVIDESNGLENELLAAEVKVASSVHDVGAIEASETEGQNSVECDKRSTVLPSQSELSTAKTEEVPDSDSNDEDFVLANDESKERVEKVDGSEGFATVDAAREDEKTTVDIGTASDNISVESSLNTDKASSTPSLHKESANMSLFDSDEDDFFSTSKSKIPKSKEKPEKSAPSAFSRSPPPLFDDDDDDTNWI